VTITATSQRLEPLHVQEIDDTRGGYSRRDLLQKKSTRSTSIMLLLLLLKATIILVLYGGVHFLTEEEEEEATMSSSRSFVVIPGSRALDTRQFMELMVIIKACEGRRESQVFWSLVLAISFFF
jgi:hypothetical protein